MATKMVLWDWNGCLLDDCEHVYHQGPVRIFTHYKLPVPSLEAYRNEVESDFMKSFYWKYGIPADVTAKDLDAIMKQGYAESGEPPLQPDAHALIVALHFIGIRQTLVTGFDRAMLETSLAHHGIRPYFEELHGNARKKTEIFKDILKRATLEPDQVVGVTDTLSDVEMLEAAGIRAYICPRGFHGRARIDAARAAHPLMVVIDGLASLADRI
jgi:phosphoglycolate phosphatase-like HAD superfamily hydrolase